MADLSKIKLNGTEYDLKDSYAREAIANIPEDKLFLINVTMNSMTSGTSDKSSAEIAAAVNAGKLPIVKTGMGQMSMMATLVNIEETQEDGETYYFATFMYNDENNGHTSSPTFATKAVMIIIGTNVILQIKTGSYITNYELEEKGYLTSYTETDPTVPAWAKQANKPTYTAAEVGALPDTTVIPAAQVNSDWNAASGVAQILNKPSIPEAETDSNVEDMLDSFNLDYTSNATNFNYANGVNF